MNIITWPTLNHLKLTLDIHVKTLAGSNLFSPHKTRKTQKFSTTEEKLQQDLETK